MFRRKPSEKGLRFNEFTVFGAFIAVAVFGLGYGIVAASLGKLQIPDEEVSAPWRPTPPLSAEEYEAQASEVMAPLLGQSGSMTEADLDPDDPDLRQLVEKTQARMLRIERIPADHKDVHLRSVLLLDQWKRALSGSAADRDVVLEKTKDLIDDYPWLLS